MRNLPGARCESIESDGVARAGITDDAQGGKISTDQRIEVVVGPVESVKLRPVELGGRLSIIIPHAKQEVACCQKLRRPVHAGTAPCSRAPPGVDFTSGAGIASAESAHQCATEKSGSI